MLVFFKYKSGLLHGHRMKNWGWATFRGRPSASRNPPRVQQMLAQDRRVTLQSMAEELGISKDTVHAIVREDTSKAEGLSPLCGAQDDKNVWQRICDRFLKNALLTVSRSFIERCQNCVVNDWRLFWRPINLICLYLLFCLFSDNHSRNVLDIPCRHI